MKKRRMETEKIFKTIRGNHHREEKRKETRKTYLQQLQNWATKHPKNHANNVISLHINPIECRQPY